MCLLLRGVERWRGLDHAHLSLVSEDGHRLEVWRRGARVGGLASTMVPGLQGCKTTWGKTHCKRSRRCQLHFHDLSVFKVTRTEVITLPSLTIVHYDHSHFLVCLFYDLPLSHCKQKTFNNSLRASLRLQVYGLFDAQ